MYIYYQVFEKLNANGNVPCVFYIFGTSTWMVSMLRLSMHNCFAFNVLRRQSGAVIAPIIQS